MSTASSFHLQKEESVEEKRYRKLLLGMDLTQDFFFSYTYDVASTLQNNLTASAQQDRFDSMFVWNDHLTRCHSAITMMTLVFRNVARPVRGASCGTIFTEMICVAGRCGTPWATTAGSCHSSTASSSSARWRCLARRLRSH